MTIATLFRRAELVLEERVVLGADDGEVVAHDRGERARIGGWEGRMSPYREDCYRISSESLVKVIDKILVVLSPSMMMLNRSSRNPHDQLRPASRYSAPPICVSIPKSSTSPPIDPHTTPEPHTPNRHNVRSLPHHKPALQRSPLEDSVAPVEIPEAPPQTTPARGRQRGCDGG